MIAEAVLDYLLAESVVGSPAKQLAADAHTAVNAVVASEATQAFRVIIDELVSRLNRQEELNLILRELLMMLSDQLRQLHLGPTKI